MSYLKKNCGVTFAMEWTRMKYRETYTKFLCLYWLKWCRLRLIEEVDGMILMSVTGCKILTGTDGFTPIPLLILCSFLIGALLFRVIYPVDWPKPLLTEIWALCLTAQGSVVFH